MEIDASMNAFYSNTKVSDTKTMLTCSPAYHFHELIRIDSHSPERSLNYLPRLLT